MVVYGSGSDAPDLASRYDLRLHLDKTCQALLRQM
jgi:hypothetical protein